MIWIFLAIVVFFGAHVIGAAAMTGQMLPGYNNEKE